MTPLLAFSIGPVQPFIQAARRTRDLWYGSHVLSEVSKAGARAVHDAGGELIYPAPPDPDSDLKPGSDFNVANVVLAQLGDGDDPDKAAVQAREAVQRQWLNFAEDARGKVDDVIDDEQWNDQVDEVIEFYAAWTPLSDGYATSRERVMRLLAGRKNLRNFQQAPGTDQGVWKSSLDARRPSVIRHNARKQARKTIRLKGNERKGEELDVVGVVKRVGGGYEAFPSVSRIACDPWVRQLEEDGTSELEEIRAVAHELHSEGPLHEVRGDRYSAFPFEGTVLYSSRHASLAGETDLDEDDDRLKRLRDLISGSETEPDPYLAMVRADGDRVGEALTGIDSPDDNRKFSGAPSLFAEASMGIVEDHQGVSVFSGGDDLLAFVPIDRVLPCARTLRERFVKLTEEHGPKGGRISLSVGVSVGNFMEPMEDLLTFARQAEHVAKDPGGHFPGQEKRDALAFSFHPRAGSEVTVRDNWKDEEADLLPLDRRLQRAAAQVNEGALSSRTGYDLKRLVRTYRGPEPGGTPDGFDEDLGQAMGHDALRLLDKKEGSIPDFVKTAVEEVSAPVALETVADELIIASRLSNTLASGTATGTKGVSD